MAGFIIIALVLFEQLQNRDAAGGEEAVGADDYQEHRKEIVGEGLHGAGNPQSDIVPEPQGKEAGQGQQPLGLGLLFAGAALAHHGHGVLPPHADQIAQQIQQQHRAEEDGRDEDAGPGDVEGEAGGEPDHPIDNQGHQPLEEHPGENAAHHAGEAENQRLPDEHGGDIALAHAQDVVEAQLLGPALHQKAVGVEKENHRKDAHQEYADLHERAQIGVADLARQIIGPGEGHQNIKDGGSEENGQKVGEVELSVVLQALPGQLGVEAFHGRSPPVVRTVRASVILP